MNHIYRLVWSEIAHSFVAVSEIAKGRGKRSSTVGASPKLDEATVGWAMPTMPVLSLSKRLSFTQSYALLPLTLTLIGAPAHALDLGALPTGGTVTAGTAAIGQAANVLTVQQSSQRAAIDWQSFNIGASATVNFNQPNANAVALNRITGNSASEIYGKLNANGQVFFTNPNGMLFARGAQVNVGGILATTMSLGNDDFMAGNYRLTNPSSGSIRNEGIINALGSVALVGNTVQNAGQIIATTVTLVAGNTVAVDLTGDGLIRARVEDAALHASIENSGNVEGTQVTLTAGQARDTLDRVVNNSGVIRAIGLTMQGGEIVLEGGLLSNTGTLDASASLPSPAGGRGAGGEGAFASGGSINLSGAAVSLGGTIAADGSTQGGNIAIDAGGVSLAGLVSATGGSGQGGNIDIQSQTTALHNVHSTLDVSGATGGSIREIAGHQITSSATYLATGTAGNGGHIDISASATKLLSAQIDASGTAGGGQIRVGGEYQGGKNLAVDELPNAETLAISAGSVIRADATQQGNGGTVILWSDLTSALYADVSAKGKNGAGGFIELSSAEKLLWGGTANAGVGGQVLMDPKNIVIQDATAGGVQYNLTLGYNYVNLPGMTGYNLAASDGFGSAVSLSGTQLVVGASGDDGFGNATTDSGAVYLFNNPYTTPTLSGIIGKGYTGTGNYDVAALQGLDSFGSAVSLSGTQLAVGAKGDDGFGNVAGESGAVYLFNNPFGGATLSGTIGQGYIGTGDFNLAALELNDNFGYSVSLTGTQLAVGAYGDDGFGNGVFNSGAAYLFNNPFGATTLSGTIGQGYVGTGDLNLVGLEVNDWFGTAVSLSGTQLAVGAFRDDGAANVALESGAVYLFNNLDTTPTFSGIIGKGYSGAGSFDLSVLEVDDYFGYTSVSLSGTQLAVGAVSDDGFGNAVTNSGAVYLFNNPFGVTALSGTIGKGYIGAGDFNLAALEAFDNFGYAVSLSGTQLAAGAFGDDGSGNVASGSGAVYLFNNPFTTPTLAGTIGKGYTGAGSFDVSALEASDYFGSAVSLSSTQLAVGAMYDDGSGYIGADIGAVYLFNNPYTTPTLSGTIGKGYTGTGNYNLTALEAGDNFGSAVSLSGTQLAVGAQWDDGFGNATGSSGAVYLFNTPFSTPTLSGTIGKGYVGAGDFNLSALEANDYFGSAVSLSGTQLVVGARGDGGFGNAASISGAVYLFNTPFSTPTLSGIIGKGYVGAGDFNLSALEASDSFGSAVSLSGTQLAVGAYGDDGFGNVASSSGAVYLFNNPFGATALSGTIGSGYAGAGDFNLTALGAFDNFGWSVSLSGTQLAVGAFGDGGFGNVASGSGAVYLFNNPFGATTLSGTIGKGYIGAGDFNLTALEGSDNFGRSVSLNGTQLAVGASQDSGFGNAVTNSGAVYLFTLITGSGDPAIGQTFAFNPGLDSTITPASITAILNTGSTLTLQANNDITVTNAIIANNTGGNGGALTLQAGRSILVNANITTDNGALVLTANDTLANGVTDAYRDAGAANITMASGTTLDAGSGTINMQISNGAGLTNNTAGTMTVGNLTASAVNLASSGGNLNGNGTVSAGTFTLNSGTWNQVAATLPSFTATDFRIAGGTFIRALSGDGTTSTPYQLADIYGVQGMGSSGMLGKFYSLAVNVDASGTSGWNAGAGFAPIGDVTTQFTGTFDGLNHTISNLTINRPAAGYVGLLGNIATGGTVSNLGLLTSNVVGSDFVGALAGTNNGNISNSYVSGGTVNGGNRDVGGLVGDNYGSISNSYSSGITVSGNWYAGGLAGENSGTITDTYSSGGTVSGVSYFGGLVGANWNIVDTSYSTNAVAAGGSNGGGLIGWEEGFASNNNYWDVQASGRATSSGPVTGLSTAQMTEMSNFTAAGWDIANTGGSGAVWRIYEGHTAPLLTSFMTPLTLTGAPDVTVTYNGAAQSGASTMPDIGNFFGVAATGTNAGFYNGYYSNQQGYDFTGGNLTITPAPLTVTAIALSKTVGNADPLLTYMTAGLQSTDTTTSTLSGALARLDGETAGLYPINQGTLVSQSTNYTLNFVPADFGIVAAPPPPTDNTWLGLLDSYWTTIGNWSLGHVPIATETVLIPDVAGTAFIQMADGTYTVKNITSAELFKLTGSGTSFTLTQSGAFNAGLDLGAGTSMTSQGTLSLSSYTLGSGAKVNLTQSGTGILTIGGLSYTVINSLGAAGSATAADLQGMSGSLSGRYALGSNIDASATSSWNSGAGFAPVGNSTTKFTGAFDGLGHTITGLTINRPTTSYIGLFGYVGPSSILKNVGLINGNITGEWYIGGLAGYNDYGTITNSYNTGAVNGASYVGGLAGFNWGGTIASSYNTGTVIGTAQYTGGLVGVNWNTITDSYNTGTVNGASYTGGLVGVNYVTITNSYSTGAVSGSGSHAGGLAGWNSGGTISNSYSTGAVSGSGYYVGGLAGYSSGTISNSYNTGAVSGRNNWVGGLTGYNDFGTIANSYNTGAVSGTDYGNYVGGLAGRNDFGTIADSYNTGTVSGSYNNVGGLAGINWGGSTIANSYNTGVVSGSGNNVGGLAGYSGGTISNSYWDTQTSGKSNCIGSGSGVGCTGLTTAQMTEMSNFTAAGWDIANTGGSGAVWRIYEGHTAPLLTSFMTPLTLTGAPDVTVTYNGAAQSGASTMPDIGNFFGVAATGTNAGFYNGYYSNQQGYDLSGGNLTINAAALNAISMTGLRAYDGTVDVAANIFTLSGLVGSQTLTLAGVGTVANQHAGTYSVTLGSLVLGDGTGLASNYTFTGGTQTATITPAILTASLNNTGVTKTYDGNTGAPVGFTPTYTIGGLIAGDTAASLNNTGAAFNFSHVATATTLTISGLGIGGITGINSSLSTDYTLNGVSSLNVGATITPAPLTSTASIGGTLSKTYTGTTTATGATLTSLVSGGIAGDTFTLTGIALDYNTAHVATANTINATGTAGFSIGSSTAGSLVSDYGFTGPTISTVSGTITTAALSVAANAANKTYDGLAYSGGNGVTYTGFVPAETSAVLGGTLAYSGTSQGAINPGSYLITPGGYTSSNYAISYVDGALTISAVAVTPPPPAVDPCVANPMAAGCPAAIQAAADAAAAQAAAQAAADAAAAQAAAQAAADAAAAQAAAQAAADAAAAQAAAQAAADAAAAQAAADAAAAQAAADVAAAQAAADVAAAQAAADVAAAQAAAQAAADTAAAQAAAQAAADAAAAQAAADVAAAQAAADAAAAQAAAQAAADAAAAQAAAQAAADAADAAAAQAAAAAAATAQVVTTLVNSIMVTLPSVPFNPRIPPPAAPPPPTDAAITSDITTSGTDVTPAVMATILTITVANTTLQKPADEVVQLVQPKGRMLMCRRPSL